MFCKYCGSGILLTDKFCPHCGRLISTQSSQEVAYVPASTPRPTLQSQYLLLSAALVIPILLFIVAFPGPTGVGLILLSLGLSLLTVAVWHIFAPRVANLMIHGFTSKSKFHVSSGKSVLLVDEPTERPLRVKEVLLRAFLPLIFVLTVSNYLGSIPFISSLGQQYGGSALGTTVLTYILSILLMPFVSVLVVPVVWIMNGLGVRFLDPKKKTVQTFQVSSIVLNMLSIGTVLSFFYQIISKTNPEGIGYNIGLIIALAWLLYPPSLLATVLYHKYSISRHILKVHQSFPQKGAGVVKWKI